MSPEQPELIENPAAVVHAMYQDAMARGANDFEPAAFQRILAKLSRNEYANPADAVKEARGILENKQDYH